MVSGPVGPFGPQGAVTTVNTTSPWIIGPNGTLMPNPNYVAVATGRDNSGQIGMNNGVPTYFTYGPQGQTVWGALAPPVNMTPGHTTLSSSNFSMSSQDPAQFAADLGFKLAQLGLSKDQLAQSADQFSKTYGMDLQKFFLGASQFNAKLAADAAEALASRTFTGGENAANRQLTASEAAANRAATAQNQGNQNYFTSGENQLNRDATSSNSALDRAQRAGEFLANYNISRANFDRQQQADKLAAAKTYTELSSSADLTGFQRFLDAGGGNSGNALLRGANSMTPLGQLGAARAYQVAQAPVVTLPDYVYDPGPAYVSRANPFAGLGATPRNMAGGGGGGGANQGSTGIGTFDQTLFYLPAQGAPGYSQNAQGGWDYTGGGAAASGGGNQDAQALWDAAGGAGSPIQTPGFALGTMHAPIMRRGQLGTGGVPAMPTGASMDSVMPRYAEGSFITGDSTDPMDPAAGGAHPEMVDLEDPPGEDNARATVTPMVPPGVGDTTGEPPSDKAEALGALLVAIGNFLSAQSSGPEEQGEPVGAGMGLSRFAYGTLADVPGSDQASVSQVMATRLATPYNINPFAADYMLQSPTARAISESAAQTATGVPTSEFGWLANKYAPGGLSRGSSDNRFTDQQLGV